MPKDPFIREKFTMERSATEKLAAEYFQRFPEGRFPGPDTTLGVYNRD